MPIREFTDAVGTRWTVWSTVPYTAVGVVASLRTGWLTFESAAIRKRLVPIPDAWEEAPLGVIRALCARADVVARTPSTGTRAVETGDRDS
jgi:hypothetical protein